MFKALLRKTKYNSRGFTIGETLLAVAILIALFALIAPNLIRIRRDLRQKELDAKAETIYIAAQARLTHLRTSGNASIYKNGGTALPTTQKPSDAVSVEGESAEEILAKLRYTDKNETVGQRLMTRGSVEDTLLINHWIIEFDRNNGSVYAVYYSEDRTIENEYPTHWDDFDRYRNRTSRLNAGAVIGYYGGDIGSTTSGTWVLAPTIDVQNEEVLLVTLKCAPPRILEATDSLKFILKISDDYGHTVTEERTVANNKGFKTELVLDDLKSAETRFKALYGDRLVSGSDLKLELTVHSDSWLVADGTCSATVNSLFAAVVKDGDDGIAIVGCGRHLQNLSESSGVNDSYIGVDDKTEIVRAEQSEDISFNTRAKTGWRAYYDRSYSAGNGYYHGVTPSGTPKFEPIVNSRLAVYDGNGFNIAGLNVYETSGNAGLFAVSDGMLLQNIRLTGAAVHGTQAGALCGACSGTGRIENCRVYLERSDRRDKTDHDIWIGGTTAGGLVGALTGGSLEISDSFAATVVEGTSCAGGLVGTSSGTLSVDTSYADCYITATEEDGATGGLVGTGSVASLENCYAAGFQTANTAAGFVCGSVTRAENCYTICAFEECNTTYSTAQAITANKVFYFSGGSPMSGTTLIGNRKGAALLALLGGDAFELDPGETVAYKLRGQVLSTYPYPRLKSIHHYGDWQAEFQAGALVYYEAYKGGVYGFYGANAVSSLYDERTVYGDGYGVVFDKTDAIPAELSITLNGEEFLLDCAESNRLPVAGTNYVIVPLGKELVNAAPTGGGFYSRIQIGEDVSSPQFFFNPLFANTIVDIQSDEATAPAVEEVTIRTARQLYNLSLYYDDHYSEATRNATFYQERSISYSAYQWLNYSTAGKLVSAQGPIGASALSPFLAVYEGGGFPITDVSFVSEDGDYIGMFGYSTGTLKDIVLATVYEPKGVNRYFVQRTGRMEINDRVCMGVLAGYNDGTIENCAVAGYYLAGADGTLHAYANCELHAGGLVGMNCGVIQNSSADCPTMRLSSTDATAVNVGGFVGGNDAAGAIENCYALGHTEVTESKGAGVNIAGFAGKNDGSIRDSYCAFSQIASGDAIAYGFAPIGGVVTNCYYLDKGTYSYAGSLHSYNSDAEITSAEGLNYKSLRAKRAGALSSGDWCRFHPNSGEGEESYPFRSVVRDMNDHYVHYGDWQLAPNLGTLGVFYWEHEEGGSNNGYHFAFIGTDEGSSDSGTTLCTAHDDSGAITEFGYGYYVQDGQQDGVTLEVTGLTKGEEWNTAAAAALHEQVSEYVFFPYTTRVQESGDFLYLSNGEKTNGTMKLTYNGNSYTYTVCPFFANAMSRVGAGVVEAADGTETNFAKTPGTQENRFEVRSAEQLQYINWNNTAKNCDQLVVLANRQQFPFLQYATVTGNGTQTKAAATANRPIQHWLQTHDLRGNEALGYTPIAGKATSSTWQRSNAAAPLYAWFGGSYNGQSYKIENLTIETDSFTAGLFGVTVGAEINNIILFGDGAEDASGNQLARIVRDTSIAGQVGDREGAYQIGGLVALAYDYDTSNEAAVSTISNCAIAGYQVVDNSANRHGMGYASIGGLFGISQIKLERCSSVAELQINYHSPIVNGTLQYSEYGNMLRVGGLVGTALFKVKDCYTGGSISIDEETLREKPLGYTEGGANNALKRANALQIFVGGIAGSCYKNGIQNFGAGNGTATSGEVYIDNCYTFLTLPKMEGNIYAASVIVGSGDRFRRGTLLHTTNCYFLEDAVLKNYSTVMEGDPAAIGYQMDFKFNNCARNYLTNAQIQTILYGNLAPLEGVLDTHNTADTNPKVDEQHPYTFEQLSADDMTGKLGAAWDWVTTREPNGASIDGKYSFSDDPTQQGKNYPFPTVIRQKDLTFSTKENPIYVNVHYGAWYSTGYEWTTGRDTMDIFADMQTGTDPWAEKTFRLSYEKAGEPLEDDPTFAPSAYWEVARIEHNAEEKYYDITIRAKKPGSAVITEEQSGASFTLSISAKLALGADEKEPVLYYGVPRELAFSAISAVDDSKEYTKRGAWTFTVKADSPLTLENAAFAYHQLVTGYEAGRHALTATFAYNYHGVNLSESLLLQTRTLGYIGLSTGDTHVRAKRTAETGESAKYTGTLTKPLGADIFLFATAADGDLAHFTLGSITVSGDGVNPENYEVSFFTLPSGAAEIESDSAYNYWGASVRYTGAGDSPAIKVTVKLTDPNGTGRYEFSVRLESVAKEAVRFDANGGVGSMHDLGVFGGKITVPSCRFTKTGYHFVYWTKDDGADALYPGEELTGLSGMAVLHAQWAPNTYTVRFDANGGSGTMADMTMTYDADAVLPACTFTSDRSFVGWRLDAEDGVYAFADGATVRNLSTGATVTLYATWKTPVLSLLANDELRQYQPKTGDSSLEGYEAPEKLGWTLEGWFTRLDEDGVKILNGDSTVAADSAGITRDAAFAMLRDVTLYAKWQANTYTVHFDANGGEGTMADIVLTYDTAEDLPTCTFTSSTGLIFAGWRAEIDGVERIFTDGEEVLNLSTGADVTLYARWRSGYPIYLSANGTPVEYMPTSGATVLAGYAAPARENWTLEGWYTAPNPSGTKVLDATGAVVGDVSGITQGGGFAVDASTTLYAKWTGRGYVPIDVLEPGMDGSYLIANAMSGDVKLLANNETKNNTTNFKSVDATVLTEGAYDTDGNALTGYILLEGTEANAPAIWTLHAPDDVKSDYVYADCRYMLLNRNGLSIRDDGSAPKMRNAANWMWNGDISNRNLWTYGKVGANLLKSQFAHAEQNSNKTLGMSGSAWTVAGNLKTYLFRDQEIWTFD